MVENLSVPFDTRVWKEARALQTNGYDVFVVCPKGQGYDKAHEILEGIHIYRHPAPKEGKGKLGFLIEYGSALFWEKIFAWKVFLKHRIHVIQGCNPPDNIFLIATPFKLFGVKYIFDHHDLCPEVYLGKFEKEDLFYRLQIWLEKMTFKACTVSIATNQTYKEVAVSRDGMSPERVFVVRNGPDSETFKPVPANPARKFGKEFLVGYVGTISSLEEADILLKVAETIKKRGRSDVHFTCVGGGPGLEDVTRLKETMGLDDTVTFTGRISDSDLLEVLSTADVCVNLDRPTKQNDSSTMIKIMEYMALYKPIVQFDLKEGRFSAGEASLYAEKGNVEDFADKVLWLLDNPRQRHRMGELGRQRIEEELAWEYSVPHLLAAYKKALDG